MATFVLGENSRVEQFKLCRKHDLFEIAANYGVPISTVWVMRELKAAGFTGLVYQCVLVVP